MIFAHLTRGRELFVGAAAELRGRLLVGDFPVARTAGANASSDLMSSHGSVFSPDRGRIRTRCQRPLSRVPSSVNARWPFRKPLLRIPLRLPSAAVPDDHRARPIFALRDIALEIKVFDRVVLGADRKPLLADREARPLVTAQLFKTPSISSRRS